jgi:hypothetical protein
MTDYIYISSYWWKNLLEAVKRKQSAAVMQILGCDENHPFSCLGLEEWYEFQEMAEYKCSGMAFFHLRHNVTVYD